MLRRVLSALVLIAFASTPAVARTRLFCRYTGVEITDCAEQQVPGRAVVQLEGCCVRQVAVPLGSVRGGERQILAPPTLPAVSTSLAGQRARAVQRRPSAAPPTGPPLFLTTRALLL